MALVALGKDYGGARTARMFGSSEWGFNRNGYVEAIVTTYVTNKWFMRGTSQFFMKPFGVLFTESHGVLADSWRLNKGEDVYGNATRPGVAKNTAFWKQVDRIYFVNKRTKGVAKGIINLFKLAMRAALALSFTMAQPPNLGESDFMQTAVVSKNYKDAKSGKVDITQDRGATKTYDSAPVCGGKGSSCPGGDALKPYGETLEGRGKYFMGCDKEMQLGCPSATLSQGNPFGDYVAR